MLDKNSKIYIAGHRGMVGSALWRNLESKGFTNLIGRTSDELDLKNQASVDQFFKIESPEFVFIAAAKVGGIQANNIYRGQFIYENLMIQNNIIHSSYNYNVKKLLFLGSSCIYPKNASQPLKEEYLLDGKLEETNEPYAIAKIAGIKMCESYFRQYGSNFISVMPTNLYGQNDNYDLETSHVLPALIRKFHLASCLEKNEWDKISLDLNKLPIENINGNSTKQEIIQILAKYGISTDKNLNVSVKLWGTGEAYREFLHVDDMAEACIFTMQNIEATELYSELKQTHINIGSGEDLTIKQLAYYIEEITEFKGEIIWDSTKPDGTFRKLQDISLMSSLGWKNQISFKEGITSVYNSYKS